MNHSLPAVLWSVGLDIHVSYLRAYARVLFRVCVRGGERPLSLVLWSRCVKCWPYSVELGTLCHRWGKNKLSPLHRPLPSLCVRFRCGWGCVFKLKQHLVEGRSNCSGLLLVTVVLVAKLWVFLTAMNATLSLPASLEQIRLVAKCHLLKKNWGDHPLQYAQADPSLCYFIKSNS